MKIFLPQKPFLNLLFPQIEDYTNLVESDLLYIKKMYSFGSHEAEVEITKNGIEITFDEDGMQKSHEDLQELITLSEKQEYNMALEKANNLIEKNPAISEYHRIKGQILSDRGYPQKAINALIEAARLDPDNPAALIMLGNIYAKNHSDADTALTFYERVLETDPENYLALNNMGGNLANLGNLDDAERYFDLAHELNADYPNTLYGLALIESKKENPEQSFEYARQAFLTLNPKDQPDLYKQNLNLIIQESRKYMGGGGFSGISIIL